MMKKITKKTDQIDLREPFNANISLPTPTDWKLERWQSSSLTWRKNALPRAIFFFQILSAFRRKTKSERKRRKRRRRNGEEKK